MSEYQETKAGCLDWLGLLIGMILLSAGVILIGWVVLRSVLT